MFKQIKYFQSVVRNNSFTDAAEECFISQSAISQQIKVLEQELGVELLKRSKRSFTLTPAGEYFYKKSLVLISDLDNVIKETARVAGNTNETILKIGVLRGFNDKELQSALSAFSAAYPDVSVVISYANHDELYADLRGSVLDIVINDQRRKFSDEYINEVLIDREYCIEISAQSLIAALDSVEISDLKNTPCILLSSKVQQKTEGAFYQNDLGFKSDIIFSERLEDARMMLIQGKGFMPLEGGEKQIQLGDVTKKIKLIRDDKPVMRRYCAFAKVNNNMKHTTEFIKILKQKYGADRP